MKKYSYILIEAALSMGILLLFFGFWLVEFNLLIVVLSLFGSLYFIGKISLGVKLILDIRNGSEKVEAIFAGNLGAEHLDFFRKVKFSNVYFESEVLSKNYLLFEDCCCDEIHPGDRVILEYYRRSRIILQIQHCKT